MHQGTTKEHLGVLDTSEDALASCSVEKDQNTGAGGSWSIGTQGECCKSKPRLEGFHLTFIIKHNCDMSSTVARSGPWVTHESPDGTMFYEHHVWKVLRSMSTFTMQGTITLGGRGGTPSTVWQRCIPLRPRYVC